MLAHMLRRLACVTLIASSQTWAQDDAPQDAVVDGLVVEAELVVSATPVSVQRVTLPPGKPPRRFWPSSHVDVVRLRVRCVLVGNPGLEEVIVLQPGGDGPPRPQSGLYFLHDTKNLLYRTSDAVVRRIERLAGDVPVFETRIGSADLWPEVDGVMELGGGVAPLGTEQALALVRESTTRVFPRVEAFLATTGPSPWRMVIDSDRVVRESPARESGEQVQLDEERWAELVSALEGPRFVSLGPQLGRSMSPGDSFVGIELRTVLGPRRVRCYSRRSVPSEEEEKFEAFLEFWNLLPAADLPRWGE